MDWQTKQLKFWIRALDGYLRGLEQRSGGVLLFSIESALIEQACVNLSRPTVWMDCSMDKETLAWMGDNCPCDVWEVMK